MRPVDMRWLDNNLWGVRGFDKGGRSAWRGRDGAATPFRFKPVGGWTTCPDWNDRAECGGGFHVQTQAHNGFGFCGDHLELVEWRGSIIPVAGDKAKVRQLRRMPCTEAVLDEALRRCSFIAHRCGKLAVRDGMRVIAYGGVITQSGGKVWTCGSSAPVITQSGGVVYTDGSSAPVITQSGGVVHACGSSAPVITQSGGDVYTYGSSAPVITRLVKPGSNVAVSKGGE